VEGRRVSGRRRGWKKTRYRGRKRKNYSERKKGRDKGIQRGRGWGDERQGVLRKIKSSGREERI
jgi:hypothetical protein